MLVTFLIIPVLIGAATFSLIGLMQGHATVANRLTSSSDAQVVSSSYFNDLQSASLITLDAGATQPVVCPPQLSSADEWLLGFQALSSTGQATLDISYGLVPSSTYDNNVATLALVRWQCSVDSQGNPVYDSVATLASHVPSPSLQPRISGVSCSLTASGSGCLTDPTAAAMGAWISTYGIQAVTLDVTDTGLAGTSGGWSYRIAASPRNWVHLVQCQPPAKGLCPSPIPIQSPGLVLGIGDDGSSTTSFQGNPCGINATAVGLNGLTISTSGHSNPFSGVTSVYGTAYDSPSQTIDLGPGKSNPLTINYAPTTDPLANDTLAEVESNLGYNQIVYVGSSWPATFTPGTIYVIGSTTPTTIPSIDMSSSGGSILLWSDSTSSIAAPSQLYVKGSTTVDLGPSGILYAPNTTLSVDGTAQIIAESVIVQNLTCKGGGRGTNLLLTSTYPNA